MGWYVCPVKHEALDLVFEVIERVGWLWICCLSLLRGCCGVILFLCCQTWGFRSVVWVYLEGTMRWYYVCPVKHKALDLLFEVIERVGWLWICCLRLLRGWGGFVSVVWVYSEGGVGLCLSSQTQDFRSVVWGYWEGGVALDLLFEVIERLGWLWICCLSLFRGWGGVMFVQSNTRL